MDQTLSPTHSLVANEVTGLVRAADQTLSLTHSLMANEATGLVRAADQTLTLTHSLMANEATGLVGAADQTLSPTHSLMANEATGLVGAADQTLSPTHSLMANEATHSHTSCLTSPSLPVSLAEADEDQNTECITDTDTRVQEALETLEVREKNGVEIESSETDTQEEKTMSDSLNKGCGCKWKCT